MADLKFNSWSASRLDDYTLCPMLAKLKHLIKMCPSCFKGKLVGKYGTVPKCDTCGKPKPIAPPLARGSEIGESLEKYVNGTGKKLHKEIKNPFIVKEAKALRSEFKAGSVQVEMMVNLDRNFNVLGTGWTPEIWLIVKLDVWASRGGSGGVLDWKTGGVDKANGRIYANEKYDDQLLTYQVAGLCLEPGMGEVSARLGFVDALGNPFVDRPTLKRKELEKAKKLLLKKSLPIMSDRTFAPKPNDKCRWCDFGKARGGPCKF